MLSAVIIMWYLGDTATLVGKAMFALPHVFTLWSTKLLLDGDKKKK